MQSHSSLKRKAHSWMAEANCEASKKRRCLKLLWEMVGIWIGRWKEETHSGIETAQVDLATWRDKEEETGQTRGPRETMER